MQPIVHPTLKNSLQDAGVPLNTTNDLDLLMDRIGDARYVLLGEASHGTSEYYTWRAAISKRLIEEKGFNFIAVEGDWPDCYEINRFVKGRSEITSAVEVLKGFSRWPTWMWSNWEVAALIKWMKKLNDAKDEKEKVGFYGLDVYSLWESMEAISTYLKENHPDMLPAAMKALQCFQPFNKDIYAYARSTAFAPEGCEQEVIKLLQELQNKVPQYKDTDEDLFSAEQNAMVAVNAEHYYRIMVRGGNSTWNIRDQHMMETLNRLIQYHGHESKGIIWEHNTHIGDARATDMAGHGMFNIGQLAREEHGLKDVVLVGFSSYQGAVIAGTEWGAPMEQMELPRAEKNSWEELMHDAWGENRLVLLDPYRDDPAWTKKRGHRAIGVVYNPAEERYGNYVPTILPSRYDAFVFIDESRALHPLKTNESDISEVPETYPFGV